MTPPPTSDAIDARAFGLAVGKPSQASRCRGTRVLAAGVAFVGPGYLVAVGYMDPGNWATDLAGGSAFGYTLLVGHPAVNLMAIVLQALSARLGIAAGLDLAQACRAHYGRPVTLRAVAAVRDSRSSPATWPKCSAPRSRSSCCSGCRLLAGVLITAFDVMLILALQRFGFRKLEAFIVALLVVIAGCFAFELWLARPDWGAVAAGLVPTPADRHQPGDALHRDRHPRRDGDAAQSLPPFLGGADARVSTGRATSAARSASRRSTRSIALGFALLHQRRDPDPRGGDVPRRRAHRRRRYRGGAPLAVADARRGRGERGVRAGAARLGAEFDDHRHARRADRDGGVPRHPLAGVAAADGDARDRDRPRGAGDRAGRGGRRRPICWC